MEWNRCCCSLKVSDIIISQHLASHKHNPVFYPFETETELEFRSNENARRTSKDDVVVDEEEDVSRGNFPILIEIRHLSTGETLPNHQKRSSAAGNLEFDHEIETF